MSDEPFLFRNFFDRALVERIADGIRGAWKEFDRDGFVDAVVPDLEPLQFLERSHLIRDTVRKMLPPDYLEALDILVRSLGPEPDAEELTGADGFHLMPLCQFVAHYGLDHPDESLEALYEMTKRFTAEGDIRVFIQRYPKKTLAFLHRLTQDPSPFARRLPSEGTRPRLPLGSRLPEFQKDPTPVIELLDRLRKDPNLMVRRSVANNLNDIAKDNPDVVVKTLIRWQDETSEMEWLTRHSLRTLIKQGHPGALELLGYPSEPAIEVEDFVIVRDEVELGQAVEFRAQVRSTGDGDQNLMIDFVMHFMKASGKTRPKVFKLARKTLEAGELLEVSKKKILKHHSTRKMYPGVHRIDLQVNGKLFEGGSFELRF